VNANLNQTNKMKKKMKNVLMISITLILTTVFFGCDKNQLKEHGSLTVFMTDQPGDYDTVNVEVVGLKVKWQELDEEEDDEEDAGEWIDLETETGNYDLLQLQDGITAILTEEEEIPVGKIGQMRLMLGENNYVVIDGEDYPLELTSQNETGLKFNLNAEIAPDETTEVLFDFDAEKSIVVTGSGKYILKPTVKVVSVTYL
jgi:hypothetical protein